MATPASTPTSSGPTTSSGGPTMASQAGAGQTGGNAPGLSSVDREQIYSW